jgi:5-methylcytosine-specific restriction endonuclease McrA
MTATESTYHDAVSKIEKLSNQELDFELEQTAALNEKTEMLLCCYLAAVRDRRAFEDFGYTNIYDYAYARFGFGQRKTRYLVSLGFKIERLPKIREALASGKLGWCKASRIASVASSENEVMWLDSALSLTVQQLERRIQDGTDNLTSTLHLPLTQDRRILWENALEIFRRRAGAEISPVEAFELMVAEVIAEWGHYGAGMPEEPETSEDESEATDQEPPRQDEASQEVFPWVEAIDTSKIETESLWDTERDAEKDFETNPRYNAVRHFVLERDGWKCTYPGCGARANLHVHHIVFRSRGGGDAPWNLTVVCNFHHNLIHSEQIAVKGGAPLALEWTPPELMRAVLERRRNNPSVWANDLDVRERSFETRAATN